MGCKRLVQLVLDDAGLHARCSANRIDLEDTVHVPRAVHDKASRQGLAVGARAAAARSERYGGEFGAGEGLGDAFEIVDIPGEYDAGGLHLINRIVG